MYQRTDKLGIEPSWIGLRIASPLAHERRSIHSMWAIDPWRICFIWADAVSMRPNELAAIQLQRGTGA